MTQFSDQGNTVNQPNIIVDIVDLLLPLDPYRIVLFGSYAKERETRKAISTF